MTDSLLAHIVTKFSSRQWENIATESLRFLLQGNAGGAPARILAPYLAVPPGLRWRTQATSRDDTGIPDLVGDDIQGRPVVVIEGKFWATLTENQPNGYLRRQTVAFSLEPNDSAPGGNRTHVLIFLVPVRRQALVAHELAARMLCPSRMDETTGLTLLDNGQLVVVISWGRILAEIRTSLQEVGDHVGVANLVQLEGLCERADTEAILPFTAQDVDTATAGRLWDFYDLVDRVTDELVRRGRTSTRGRSSAGGKGYYNRGQLALSLGYDVAISFLAWSWTHNYPSPLWLRVWQPLPAMLEVGQALVELGVVPHAAEHAGWLEFALPIPLGVEAEVAVTQIVDRVERILDVLPAKAPLSADDETRSAATTP